MNRRTVYFVLSSVLMAVFLFSTGMTLASWAIEGSTINQISIAVVRGRIIEDFERDQVLYPASRSEMVVRFKNTGTVDAAIRVKVKKAWGNKRNEDGSLIINPALSTDNIVIEYNNSDWYYRESDGYYYYKGVLAPEDLTTDLLRSFVLNNQTTSSEYRSKHADITVTMEMVQAAYNGLSLWNMNFDELGVSYVETQQLPIATAVNFVSPSAGFEYDAVNNNLFSGFKNLVPGESVSQIIKFTNQWNENAEISIWADSADQVSTSQSREVVEKMLREYATIVITDEDGEMIYTGPVWGNLDLESNILNSMQYPRTLGTFSPGETKTFNVTLSLDPSMDNEYKNMLGRVKWCFSAKGVLDDGTSSDATSSDNSSNTGDYVTTTPVKTGYENRTVFFAGMMVVSAAVLCVFVLLKRRKDHA